MTSILNMGAMQTRDGEVFVCGGGAKGEEYRGAIMNTTQLGEMRKRM